MFPKRMFYEMKFKIGRDKFPLIEFEESKYAHVFPVTKYQFERYIWETASDVDYDELIKANPRISPDALDNKKLKQLFMTGLSFTEASNFAKWMGGRLPAKGELDKFGSYISRAEIGKIRYYLSEHLKKEASIDKRFLTILTVFENMNIEDVRYFTQIGEFCREYISIDGRIYIKRLNGSYSEIVGDDPPGVKNKDYGFRVIKIIEEV